MSEIGLRHAVARIERELLELLHAAHLVDEDRDTAVEDAPDPDGTSDPVPAPRSADEPD